MVNKLNFHKLELDSFLKLYPIEALVILQDSTEIRKSLYKYNSDNEFYFPEKGLSLKIDPKLNKIKELQVIYPYKHSVVHGIKIGDTQKNILKTLGKPDRTFGGKNFKVWVYNQEEFDIILGFDKKTNLSTVFYIELLNKKIN